MFWSQKWGSVAKDRDNPLYTSKSTTQQNASTHEILHNKLTTLLTTRHTAVSPIMSEQAPRINAPLLEQFQNRVIRIVGKVVEVRGDKATIDSHGSITVFLDRVCGLILLCVSLVDFCWWEGAEIG